jgi:hypothetical protein
VALGMSVGGLSAAGAGTAVAGPQAVTYFAVTNHNSGKCADVREASFDDNAVVNQYGCTRANNQQWAMRTDVGGFQLVARHSGKCVGVAGASRSDKAGIVQVTCVGTASEYRQFN